ncbi:MAG: efflux RND transporter periplasmic adaptor subunit [Burkholderiales bacterium]|nr:efflux RND transporter periplasmic adaptor subunit [Rhodocyclaceae bacterium]MCA3054014.1 efflux RND transporter periplasmic adaptor subunit [Rhodocyclaceae bacterium]
MSTNDLSKLTIDRSKKAFVGGGRSRKKWWLGVAVLIAIVAGAAVIRSGNRQVSVELGTVASAFPTQAITTLNATGRVSAFRKAAVSTKATGKLEYLGVQEGSIVKAGQVLARIENKDVIATRDQALANLRAAKANAEQGLAELRDAEANLRRTEDLAKKNFISGAQLDTAIARHDRAKASVAALNGQIGVAEANLRATNVGVEQTVIRAPFDGVILTKNANVGDIITPFSSAADSKGAVVNIADMTTLEVEADVSESSLSKISADMPVEIQLDAFPDLRLLGRVSRIVPTVDRSKATVLVKVAFVEKDNRVLPDMSAKVAFLQRAPSADERKAVTAVQPAAVVKRDGKDVVFVIDEKNIARMAAVTTSGKLGDLVQVSGIKPGDKVALKPDEKLKDGGEVVINKK